MKKLLAGLLMGLSFQSHAAGIGTPVQLGVVASSASVLSIQIVTLANIKAGDAISVAAGASVAGFAISSVTDDSGNVYAAGGIANGVGSARMRIFTCLYCLAMASGGHITITYGAANTNPKMAGAITYSGASFVDGDGGSGTSGTSVNPAITTSTQGVPNELLLAGNVANGAAGDTFTEAAGWNSNTAALGGGALHWAYKLVGPKPGTAYSASYVSSHAWVAQFLTIEGPSCTIGSQGAGVC